VSSSDVAPGAGAVLVVENLRVNLISRRADIVDEVSFEVTEGEVLGLVGESGSGKTTVGLALLGHMRRGAVITGGSIRIDGRDLLRLPPEEVQGMRGRLVSYVPQDPSAALNPALRIETQLEEILAAHGVGATLRERRERVHEMLDEVLLPHEPEFLRRYPHQLSGGQQQRAALAMAFACRPRVIVLDEPTTGLDVSTQAHVLETVRELCRTHRVAAVYITHDLAVVAALAARVAVMYAGRLVEIGTQRQLFTSAGHPYTRRLIQAIPNASGRYALVGIPGRAPAPGLRPAGCFFAARCDYVVDACHVSFPPVTNLSPAHETRCFRSAEVAADSILEGIQVQAAERERRGEQSLLSARVSAAFYGEHRVLHDVRLDVWPRECVALVGESGSGKTTFARCIAGLHRDYSGEVLLRGLRLAPGARARSRETRKEIQYIFQSPYGSLNPRKTVGQIVGQPFRIFYDLHGRAVQSRVAEVLERVALSASYIDHYPDQLSGGERQRVAIARALAAEPSLLVCDEITSALDVSVQAAIVELLGALRRDFNLGLVFVTHNLALIRSIAEEVAVMSEGRIVEFGAVEGVLEAPKAAYTRQLLADTPRLEAALV
jgi:peptide/nickel transport system ATP-binding protein